MNRQPAPAGTAPSGLNNFCGPAAIAAITGWSRERAADELAHVSKRKGYRVGRNGSTDVHALYHVLKEFGYQPELNLQQPRSGDRAYGTAQFPTVAQWLKANRTYAVILAAHHFMVVRDGQIVEDNNVRPTRGRVHWVLTINDPQPAAMPQTIVQQPASAPEPRTAVPNAVRRLHRLAGSKVGGVVPGASTVHLEPGLQLEITWDVTRSGGYRVRTYLWNTATGKRQYVSQTVAKQLINRHRDW